MSDVSIRGLVRLIQVEVRDTPDLLPDRAAELLNKLAALSGNINDSIREADLAYSEVLLKFLDSDEAANRARIRAETTPEYQLKRQARDTLKLAANLISSLKYFMRCKAEEYRYAGHQ